MQDWLAPALDTIASWLAFQVRALERPGCVLAMRHGEKLVLETAFGHANLATREALTPRHRFRVASHSKSFTAAAIMLLRERGLLSLDQPVGRHVRGLHEDVSRVTIAQLLSHSAGLTRDGDDKDFFLDRRPFPDADEFFAALAVAPVIEPSTRLKYSNIGYSLLGLVIEAISGEPFSTFIKRELIDAAGLSETEPDVPGANAAPLAAGHTGRVVLGHRLAFDKSPLLEAMAPAGGFVSTAADLSRFFAQLSPSAERSILTPASRREMVRRQWRDPSPAPELHYGYGIMSSTTEGWDWFGHSGSLQGYITRTAVLPDENITISVLTNSIDGPAGPWVDGVIHILKRFAAAGRPSDRATAWAGRWWSLWGDFDLVPMGERVLVAAPALGMPFTGASEIEIDSETTGQIAAAGAFGSYGEPVRCERAADGSITRLWVAGTEGVTEEALAREMRERYTAPA